MSDVVDTGPERRPVGRAAYVAGAVVLTVLAAAGVARSLREPARARAAASPSPSPTDTPSVGPLQTADPVPEVAPTIAGVGDYAGTVRVTFATNTVLLGGSTGDAPALQRLAELDAAVAYLPLAHGWATIERASTLRVHGPDGEVNVPIPWASTLHEAAGPDEFWASDRDTRRATRFDVRGRRLRDVRLPRPWQVVRGTRYGLVAASAEEGAGGVALFGEDGRLRRVLTRTGNFLAAGDAAVAWTGDCDGSGCLLFVDDLRTGKPWPDDFGPGQHATFRSAAFSSDGARLAYATVSSAQSHAYVFDSRQHAVFSVADSPEGELDMSWVDNDRAALVERYADRVTVYVWTSEQLGRAAGYPVDELVTADVRPG